MDGLTSLIKSEIKKQYGSVARFSDASGIPYGTITNAMSRGIGTSSYDTVTQICKVLKIKRVFDDDLFYFNKEFYEVYNKLTKLDAMGVHTVCVVLNAEYQRCNDEDDPWVKGFSGISLVRETITLDKKAIRKLIKKMGKGNNEKCVEIRP